METIKMMSDDISQLAEAMSKVQGDLGPIYKSKSVRSGSYSYKYADLSEIWECIRLLLSENKLCVMQGFTQQNGTTLFETVLAHSSGQWIKSHIPITRHEKIQTLGSEITYLRRYALGAILGIVADEDEDGCMANGADKVKKEEVIEPQSALEKRLYKNFDKSLHSQVSNYLKELSSVSGTPFETIVDMALNNVVRFTEKFEDWRLKNPTSEKEPSKAKRGEKVIAIG